VRRGTLTAIIATAAILAIGGGGIWLLGSSGNNGTPSAANPTSRSTTTAPLTPGQAAERADALAWEAKVADAFKPLVADVQTLATGAREYLAGTRPADTFRAEVDKDLADFRVSRDQAAALPPFTRAPAARDLYVSSAGLYVDVARAYAALVRLPIGAAQPVRVQLDALARRVHTLADRVYDRGRAVVSPLLHDVASPDIEIRLPEEVPDWIAEGVAPGPPLEPQAPPPAGEVQLRQDARPTEDRPRWVAAVRAAGIPAAAIADRAALARAEVAAAETLRKEPDPAGPDGREASARLRLDLLVYADGHRAEQLAAITAAPELANIARDLLSIADGLWPGGDLGPRPEGRT
jgi:hypothetical protein